MQNSNHSWSRRKFITTLSGAGGMLALQPFSYWTNQDIDPRVAAIVKNTIGVDAHNHIDVPINAAELPGPNVDLSGELKKSGLSAICMTFAVDYQKINDPSEGYDRFTNALSAMDKILLDNKMKRATNLVDVRTAHDKGQPIVIQSVEGGHFLDGKIERVGIAYHRGLRHLGLLHDSDASVPLGDVYTNPARWGGLTEFGTAVIKECNKLGILVDLTHCNNKTINAALNVSAHPIIISHTGLDTQLGQNANFAKMMLPRLISKEQAKIVANAGGVIGVWTHLSDTPIEYAQNIRALADIVGTDHVCIGTDTKMTPSYRSPGAPGGNNQNKRIGERTNEAWKDQQVGFYFAVVDALLKTGFTEDEIAKIGGGNYLRVFDESTKGH